MVAAPQYSTFIFRGLRTGLSYIKDAYLSDVAAALVRFDSGGGAGTASDTFWIPPEPVIMLDFSIVTGMTDTTKLQVVRDGVTTGDILRYAIHLTTLANRPILRVIFGAGAKVGGIQLA